MSKLYIHTYGKIYLDRNGNWFHNNEEFVHQGMIKAFYENIISDERDSYSVRIGSSEVPIEVEELVLWVTDAEINEKSSEISLSLTNGEDVRLDNSSSLYIKNDELYLHLQDGRKAKFFRKSYNILTRYLEENKGQFFIRAGKLKINIDYIEENQI